MQLLLLFSIKAENSYKIDVKHCHFTAKLFLRSHKCRIFSGYPLSWLFLNLAMFAPCTQVGENSCLYFIYSVRRFSNAQPS